MKLRNFEDSFNSNKIHFGPSENSKLSPDTFRTRKVYDSDIFRFGLFGSIIGGALSAVLGFLISYRFLESPWLKGLSEAGGFVVIASFAGAGVIIAALAGSLVALYSRG